MDGAGVIVEIIIKRNNAVENRIHLLGSFTITAALLISASMHVSAQDNGTGGAPKDELTVLIDNDRVRVIEDKFKPGAESEVRVRPYRVARAITGGVLQRIYADGRKAVIEWKSGEVKFLEPSEAYKLKNIGRTEVLLYVVNIK